MSYSPRKNKKVWGFVITAFVLALIVVMLIIYNMSKDRTDDELTSSSSSISTSIVSQESSTSSIESEVGAGEFGEDFQDPNPPVIDLGPGPTPSN